MSNPAGSSTSASSQLEDAAGTLIEARADPRVAVDLPVTLLSRGFSGGIQAGARDLSVGGVCVATPSMLAFDSVRRISIQLPSGPVELDVEGLWQTESTRDVLTGLRFLGPGPEELEELWGVVHTASKQLGLFLFARSDLRDLHADETTSLAESSRYRIVSMRDLVYAQDRRSPGDDSIFVVIEGGVSLMVRLAQHREQTLEQLRPGAVFGGLPLVADLANQESAIADMASTLLEISGQSYAYLRVAKPLLAQRLSQIITRRQLQRTRALAERVSGAA